VKKKILYGFAILAIAAVAAFNLNFNNDENVPSPLTLANVEALAEENNSNPQGWSEDKAETTSYMDGREYKRSVIINCYEGGPQSSCTRSCKYQLKNDNGTWTDWMYC
jgi:hypothetical protein